MPYDPLDPRRYQSRALRSFETNAEDAARSEAIRGSATRLAGIDDTLDQAKREREQRDAEATRAAIDEENAAMAMYEEVAGRRMARGADGRLAPVDDENAWNDAIDAMREKTAAEVQTERDKALTASKSAAVERARLGEAAVSHQLADPALKSLSDTDRAKLETEAQTARVAGITAAMPAIEKRLSAIEDKDARKTAIANARMGIVPDDVVAAVRAEQPDAFAAEDAVRQSLAGDDEIRARRSKLETERHTAAGRVLSAQMSDPLDLGDDADLDRRHAEVARQVEAVRLARETNDRAYADETSRIEADFKARITAPAGITVTEYQRLLAEKNAATTRAKARYEKGKLDLMRDEAKADLARQDLETLARRRQPAAPVSPANGPAPLPMGTPAPSPAPTAAPASASPGSPAPAVSTDQGAAAPTPSTRETATVGGPEPQVDKGWRARRTEGADFITEPRLDDPDRDAKLRARRVNQPIVLHDPDATSIPQAREDARRMHDADVFLHTGVYEGRVDPFDDRQGLAPNRWTPEESRKKADQARALVEQARNVVQTSGPGAALGNDLRTLLTDTQTGFLEGRVSAQMVEEVFTAAGYDPKAALADLDRAVKTERQVRVDVGEMAKIYATGPTRVETFRPGEALKTSGPIAAVVRGAKLAMGGTDAVQAEIAGKTAAWEGRFADAVGRTREARDAQVDAMLASRGYDDETAERVRTAAAIQAVATRSQGMAEKLARIGNDPRLLAPFINDLVALEPLMPAAAAAIKARSGGALSPTDEAALRMYLDASGDATMLGNVVDIVSQLPAFAVEIYTTGGTATIAKKGASKAILGVAGKMAGREIAETALRQVAARSAAKNAAAFLGRAGVSTVGVAAQTPVAMADFIAADTFKRMVLPDLEAFQGEGAEELQAWAAAPGQKFGPALGAAYFDAVVEMGSEGMGGVFGKIGDEAIASLTPALRERLARTAWVSAFRKLNASAPVSAVAAIARRGQFHGTLSEMAEERAGEILRGIGYAATDGAIGEEYQLPTAEQIATEMLAFAVPNGAIAAINTRAANRAKKQNREMLTTLSAPAEAFGGYDNPATVAEAANTAFGRDATAAPFTPDEIEALEAVAGPVAEFPAVRRIAAAEEGFEASMVEAERRDDLATLGEVTLSRAAARNRSAAEVRDALLTHREAAHAATAAIEAGDEIGAAMITGGQKLATGRPLAEMTVAERNVWFPQPVLLPDGTEQPAPVLVEEVNGLPVVTDAGKAALAGYAGRDITERLLPMPEAKARRLALNPTPTWKPSSSPSADSTSSRASSAPGSNSGAPEEAVGTRTDWVARGNLGTVVRIPGGAASSLEEAGKKLAVELARVTNRRELLEPDSVEPPSVRTQRAEAAGQEEIATAEAEGDQIPGLAPEATPEGDGATAEDSSTVRRLDPVRRALEKKVTDPADRQRGMDVIDRLEEIGADGVFEAVEFVSESRGPMEVSADGKTLRVNLPWLGKQVRGRDHLRAAITEEVIHAVALDKLDAGDVAAMWRSTPEQIQEIVLASYRYNEKAVQDGFDDVVMGHELIRMIVQDRAFRSQVTEAMDADAGGFGKKLRQILDRLVTALRDYLAGLDPENRAQVEGYVGEVIAGLEEMGVRTQADPAGQKSETGGQRSEKTSAPKKPRKPRKPKAKTVLLPSEDGTTLAATQQVAEPGEPPAEELSDGWKKTAEAFDGLFMGRSALAMGTADPITQASLPAERLGKFIEAAAALIGEGIRTPQALAEGLDRLAPGGQLRQYSQAFWDAFGMVDNTLRGTHDWDAIYNPAQAEAEVPETNFGNIEDPTTEASNRELEDAAIRYRDRMHARLAKDAAKRNSPASLLDEQLASWTLEKVRPRVTELIDVIDSKNIAALARMNNGLWPVFWDLFQDRTGIKVPSTQKGITAMLREFVGEEAYAAYESRMEDRQAERDRKEAAKEEERKLSLARRAAEAVTVAAGPDFEGKNAPESDGAALAERMIAAGWRVEAINPRAAVPQYRFVNRERGGYLKAGKGWSPILNYARMLQATMPEPADQTGSTPAPDTVETVPIPTKFSAIESLIRAIDEFVSSVTAGGTKPMDRAGRSYEAGALKRFIESNNFLVGLFASKSKGPEVQFRLDAKKATTFAELRSAAEKYLVKLRQEAPEAPSDPLESPTEPSPTGLGTKSMRLAEVLAQRIRRKEKTSIQQLSSLASEIFGGTTGSGFDIKTAYDTVEMAINTLVLDSGLRVAVSPEQARENLATIREWLEYIPTQTRRTGEMDALQQFSTPPHFAYLSAWVAGVNANDVGLEPSAGLGGLASFMSRAGADVILNELSDRRRQMLDALAIGRPATGHDAGMLHAILLPSINSGALPQPTVVVMNPPFSNSAAGRKDLLTGGKHIEEALKLLAPGGRLVAIVGEGMAMAAPRYREWWQKIEAKYAVRANIHVDGREYTKYGTSFSNRILVIDKVAPTGEAIVQGEVRTIEELIPLLDPVRLTRPEANERGLPDNPPPSDQSGSLDANAEGVDDTGDVPGPADSGTGASRPGAGGRGGRGSRSGARGGRRGADGGSDAATGQSTDAAAGNDVGSEAAGGQNPGGTAGAVGSDLTAETGEVEKAEVDANEIFSEYRPRKVRIKGAQPHPSSLVESSSMASVDLPDNDILPNIPADVVAEGAISAAQLEAVAYAARAHETVFEDGRRQGFFIGDGTGVGKGREIAGVIFHNWREGRRKAVWVSEKRGLYDDAGRDFRGIGAADVPLIDMASKIATPDGDGVAFLTYDSLKENFTSLSEDGQPVKVKPDKPSRAEALLKWLGKDFDGVIALDEAHNAGNLLEVKKGRGTSKPSAAALAVNNLQLMFPNARIVYASATGATEPQNVAFADRLGLWGIGKAFTDARVFYETIRSAGISAMEIFARDLKSMGLYMARTLSFKGKDDDAVEFERLEHALTADQEEIYRRAAEGWQTIFTNIDAALNATGAQNNSMARSVAMSALFGSQQRFFNNLLTSLQMPTVLADMQRRLDEGGSIVVQLVNTNESALDRALVRALEENPDNPNLEALDLSNRQDMLEYINTSFPVQQFVEKQTGQFKADGTPVTVWVPLTVKDENGKEVAVLNPEAVERRDALLQNIATIQMPDPPIEQLINFFGHENVAEITGRKKRVINAKDDNGRMRRQIESKRTDARLNVEKDEFLEGKRRVLIFSNKGGTGFSYHAGKTFKNQQRRYQYVIQPGWRADKAIQGLGRTHRADQVRSPFFILAGTNVRGHQRFISTIARRLQQLGALTSGERKSTGQGLFKDDDNIHDEYGENAVILFFRDLHRNNIPGLNFLETTARLGYVKTVRDEQVSTLLAEDGTLNQEKLPGIDQFLNRILALPIAEQNLVYDSFMERRARFIERAKENGVYDIGVESFLAPEAEISSDETVYESTENSSKTRLVEIEYKKFHFLTDFASVPTGSRFYQNRRTGKIYAFTPPGNSTKTLDNGRVVPSVAKIGIRHYEYVGENEITDEGKSGPRPGFATVGDEFDHVGNRFKITEIVEAEGSAPRRVRVQRADGDGNDFFADTQYMRSLYEQTGNVVEGVSDNANFLPDNYPLDRTEAKAKWDAELEAHPKFETKKATFIVGTILPVWHRIPKFYKKVKRVSLANGESFLGVEVPEDKIDSTRAQLGAASAEITPGSALTAILDRRASVKLSNGWSAHYVFSAGEPRIEIIGPPMDEWSKAWGTKSVWEIHYDGFMERINYRPRFFLNPTPAAMDGLFRTAPPMEVVYPEDSRLAMGVFSADQGPRTKDQELAAAAAMTDTNPTEAQKEAGNFRKGKVTIQGLRISIENPAGSERRGTNKAGVAWSVTMPHHYGYFLGTEGRDGDHVDVFIGPEPENPVAYVVNQINPDTRRFDEHKVMLGFPSRRAAIEGYKASYTPGWRGLGSLVEIPVASLPKWLNDGDQGVPLRAKDVPVVPATKPTQGQATRTPDAPQPLAMGVTGRDGSELVAIHNLTEKAIRHADQIGGLPVPSLAITKASQGLAAFGEISLIAPKSIVDPQENRDAKLFDADVYSPRYPTIHIGVDSSTAEKIAAFLNRAEDVLGRATDEYEVKDDIKRDGFEAYVKRSNAGRVLFLQERSLPMPELTKGGDAWGNGIALRKAIEDDPEIEADFNQWVDGLAARERWKFDRKIFRGWTNSGRPSYKPETIENVVAEMSKKVRNGEGFHYGPGSIRSLVAKGYRSLEAIGKERDRIISKEAMDLAKKESSEKLVELASQVDRSLSNFADDLEALVEGDFKYLRNDREYSTEFIGEMRDYLAYLRAMPSEYFEVKVKRAVSLREFAGAVIPSDASADVVEILRRKGLEFETYQRRNEVDRNAAMNRLIDRLPESPLFMGYSREADDEAVIFESLEVMGKALPSDADLEARRAEFAARVEATGGMAAPDDLEIMSAIVREAYMEDRKGQTHEHWFDAARRLIAKDSEGVVRALLEAAREDRPLDSPTLVKASQILVPRIMAEAMASRDPKAIRDAMALQLADYKTGTSASLTLGARRRKYANNADKHRDLILSLISKIPPREIAAAKALPTPREKSATINRLKAEMRQITAAAGVDRYDEALAKIAEMEAEIARLERLNKKNPEIKKLKDKLKSQVEMTRRLQSDLASASAVQTEQSAEIADLRERIERAKGAGAAGLAEIARLNRELANVKTLHNASVAKARESIARLGRALGEARKQRDRAEVIGEAHEARLARVEQVLRDMGLTLHDLFSGQAVARLRGSEIVARVIEDNFSAPQRAAIRYSLPPQGMTERQAAEKAGVSRQAVPEILGKFRKLIEARFRELARRGMTLRDFQISEQGQMFDLSGRIGDAGEAIGGRRPLGMAAAALSESQVEAAVGEMMDALFGGIVIEGNKVRTKNAKPFDLESRVDAAQVARVIQTAVDGNVYDMVFEAWINNILSGPQTHAVNIAGNAGNLLLEYGLQRWMEAGFNLAIGDPRGATFGEYRELLGAIPRAWADGLRRAKETWLTEESFLRRDLLLEPTDIGDIGDKAGGSRRAIPGRAGQIVRTPGRALIFMDTLFKTVVAHMEVAGQAYRDGRAQGLKGDALRDHIDAELLPGSSSWHRAMVKADELTFTSPLRGAELSLSDLDSNLVHGTQFQPGGLFEQWVKKLQDARSADSTLSPLAAALIGWFFPFIQTPFNIYKAGLRRTPFGLVGVASHLLKSGIVSWRNGRPFLQTYGHARLARDLTDQTIGAMVTAILFGMVEGDDDDDEKAILVTGTRPYGVAASGERALIDRMDGGAMTIRVGTGPGAVRFDYSRLEPFSTVIASVADAARSIKRMQNGAAKIDEMAKFHQYALSQATDKTFLQGVVKIGEIMEPGRSTGSNIGRAVAQFLVPNLVRQPLRLLDDYARESRTASPWYHAFPLGGLAEAKIDLYGNPVRKDGTPAAGVLGPVDRAARILVDTALFPNNPRHPADVALRNWNRANPNETYYPSANMITTYTTPTGEKRKLTAEQLSAVERIGGRNLAILLAQQITPAEAQNPTAATIQKIEIARSNVFREARDQVVKMAIPPTPKRNRSLSDLFGMSAP